MASLGRAAGVMALGTLTSRVLGFGKVIALAYAIGQTASVSADAFAVGSLLPNILFVMLIGGMLNSVLVPQIVQATKHADGGAAYINKLLTLVITVAAALTTLTLVAAPLLVRLNALDWGDAQLALATAFAYWCLPQLLFYGVYTVMGEVLNARSVFGPYTWAPVLNNIVAIAGIIVFVLLYGADPDGLRTVADWDALAIAVIAGSGTLGIVLQALLLFPYWRRAGITYRPDFRWRGVGLGKAARLSGWTLAMFVVLNGSMFVTGNIIATDSGVGLSVSAVNNAWLVMVLPHSVFVYSLTTAYFTRFSEAIVAGDTLAFGKDFRSALRQTCAILGFFAAAVFAVAPQLSRVIQVSAAPEYVLLFASLLQFYIFAMVAHSLLFVVQRGFYALSDTRTVFFLTLVQLGVVLPLAIAALLLPVGSRSFAVVIAQGLGLTVQLVVALVVLQRRTRVLQRLELLPSLLKFTLAAAITAICGWAATAVLVQLMPQLPVLVALGSGALWALLLAVVYGAVLLLLREPEVAELGAVLRRKLRR